MNSRSFKSSLDQFDNILLRVIETIAIFFFNNEVHFSIYLYFSSWTHKLLLVSSSAVTIESHNRRCVLGEQLSYLIGNQIPAPCRRRI